DNRLAFDGNTSRIVSESGDFGTSFAASAGDGDLVSISKDGKVISWSLSVSDGETKYDLSSQSAPEYTEKGKDKDFSGLDINDPETFELDKAYGFISYPSLFEELPEISANYTIAQNRVEEDVYINSPTSAKSFSMNLRAEGLSAVLNEDNSVSLTDESGEQFRIGSPYMEDAKGETLYDIAVSVSEIEGVIVITYTPDEEWLSDESRAYPILLDPSVTTKEYASNIVDTYVTQNSTTDNSAKKTLYYGIYNSKINRIYIRVNNLPNIDPTMPVTGATLKMTFMSGTTTGKTANIYKPLSSWAPSTITYANQPGYNNASPLASVPYNSSQSYMNFDVSSDVISLYLPGSSSNNYGYMIRYADETNVNPDYNVFCSIDNNTASKRPVMTVTYGYSLPSSLSTGSVYAFRNVGSQSFMNVHNGTNANDTNVYQKSVSVNSLTNAQKFKLDYVSSTGGYYLRAMCSSNGTNRVLDVYKLNGYVSDTSNVQIYNPTDSLAQHWFIIGLGLYQFKIVPRTDMSLALTAYGDSDGTSSGTTSTSAGNIFLSTYTGSSYQKWYIYDSSLNQCESEEPGLANGLPGTISTGTVTIGEGITYQLNIQDLAAGETVAWYSFNTSVATVSSSGLVTAVRAGSARVRAIVADALGQTKTSYCTVNVIIDNGIYTIKNAGAQKYLGTDGCILSGTPVTADDFIQSASGLYAQSVQQWKIQHISGINYVIRPYYKSDMGMAHEGTSVKLGNAGPATPDVNSDYSWQIKWDGNGYKITYDDYALTYYAGSLYNQSPIPNADVARWTLNKMTTVAHGVALYNRSTGYSTTDTERSVVVGQSRTMADLGYAVAVWVDDYNNQNVTWSSSNTSVATVDSDGKVTGVSVGTATITATRYMHNVSYTAQYTLHVVPFEEGTFFLKNRQSSRYADIEDRVMAAGTNLNQWDFHGEETERWIFELLETGYYVIHSANSSGTTYYLGVDSDSTSSGADIVLRMGSITNSMKWKIEPTSSGAFKFVPKSASSMALAVKPNLLGLFPNGCILVQETYSNDSNYRDEWDCIRLLPTNGYEIAYNSNDWSGIPSSNNNCYAYAINNQVYEPTGNVIWYKQQPGQYYNIHRGTGSAIPEGYQSPASIIVSSVLQDFNKYNSVNDASVSFTPIGRYEICPAGTYKVALVVSDVDYHWYRQDADGLWSHKQGTTPVKRTDNSGNLIIDPQLANRGDYTTFVGYYAVCPWNNLYVSSKSESLIDEKSMQTCIAIDDSLVSLIKVGMPYESVVNIIGSSGYDVGSGTVIQQYMSNENMYTFLYTRSEGEFTVSAIIKEGISK
ncbi:MAG: RICIN domain-containing protein, partial [Clostridia bacterium]|nr:RICIN domain-containing protein [Clostridia bacterium]